MTVDLSIFKDYDIRGTYPQQINGGVATSIAHAIVRHFKPKSVAIGRDMRLSGPELLKAFSDTFVLLGVDVYDLGLIGTEMMSFVAGAYPYDLVIQISASHNPPEYNGLKMTRVGAVPVSADTGLRDIRDLMAQGPLPAASKPGKVQSLDIYPAWRKKILSLVDVSTIKPLKVIVDAGNGMAGKLAPALYNGLPIRLSTLFMELDGSFPNHVPNPLIESNNKTLIETVMAQNADVGLTFDGDADRMFLIDDKGRFVSGTVTAAMLARYYLKQIPGSMILYNAICGRIVPQTIEKYGGKSKRVRVGYSYIKAAMKETNAVFCGEHSGHYFHRDFFNSETGVGTALMVMSLLSQDGRKLSELVDELNIYPASGEINFIVDDISSAIASIKTGFPDAQSVDELDGVSVWYKDYWFNVRASKTEPLLRLNVEADTKELLDAKREELVGKIESLGGQQK